MAIKTRLPIQAPFAAIFASQKSSGKTHLATFVADALILNDFPFRAFQIDDQKRLSHMIGDVGDLRPDPDLLIDDPTLLTRALNPFYEAASQAVETKTSVILDTGANEVETLCNFLRDVGFGEDAESWGLPVLAFVPFFPLDPESTTQSAFTVRRLLAAMPRMRVILVENRYGGSVDRIVAGSYAEVGYRDLLAAAKGVERLVMPAIPREYWAPFEGAGLRFLKALGLDPAEAGRLLGRSRGEIKVMQSNIARFWRAMHAQLSQIIVLPRGGQ